MTGKARRTTLLARPIRTIVFWLHLALGAVAGLVILVMAATGAMLAFEPQILALVDRGVRHVEPRDPGMPRLPIDTLVERAAAQRQAVATGVTLESDPSATVAVAFGRAAPVLVDPYSGDVVGEPSAMARAIFQGIANGHRWLGAAGAWRGLARSVTGAANLAFLALAVSGVYLWWPRPWTPARLRTAIRPDLRLRGKARDFNWHTALGFWCAPILVVLAGTGVVMSYSWANDLVYRVTGSAVPVRTPSRPAVRRDEDPAPRAALDRLVDRAQAQLPTWDTMTLRLGSDPEAAATVTMSDRAHWNRFARSTVTLEPVSADVLAWEPYEASSAGRRVRGWIRFAHTGELGGPIGQVLAFAGCVGGVMLVWTGLGLALRRFRSWRRMAPRQQARAA